MQTEKKEVEKEQKQQPQPTPRRREIVPFILKVKYSLYSTLIFFLIANPETYRFTQSVFGSLIASKSGSPSSYGFFLHTFIFFLAILGLMMFPSD
jgi:hypothetical protein